MKIGVCHRHREQTCRCRTEQGGGGGSEMEWGFGFGRCKLLHIGWITIRSSCIAQGAIFNIL